MRRKPKNEAFEGLNDCQWSSELKLRGCIGKKQVCCRNESVGIYFPTCKRWRCSCHTTSQMKGPILHTEKQYFSFLSSVLSSVLVWSDRRLTARMVCIKNTKRSPVCQEHIHGGKSHGNVSFMDSYHVHLPRTL